MHYVNMMTLCNNQNITWLALCYKARERRATISLHNLLQTLTKVWKKFIGSVCSQAAISFMFAQGYVN